MAQESNGNGRNVPQWILNAVLAICIAAGGWMYQNESNRHLQEAAQLEAWRQVQQQKQSEQDARIAVLESKIDSQTRILEQLNLKMDRLLLQR